VTFSLITVAPVVRPFLNYPLSKISACQKLQYYSVSRITVISPFVCAPCRDSWRISTF